MLAGKPHEHITCHRQRVLAIKNGLIVMNCALLLLLDGLVTIFYDVAIMPVWEETRLNWGIAFSLLTILSSILSALYFYNFTAAAK